MLPACEKKFNAHYEGSGVMDIVIDGKYRHYKGNEYLVIDVATHSETEEEMVVYKALYGEEKLWVRPLSMWNEKVNVNGEEVTRFTYIGK